MKMCGSCARFVENAKEAHKMGMSPRKSLFKSFLFSRRPRANAPCACIHVDNWENENIRENTLACSDYQSRWEWNRCIFRKLLGYYVERAVRNLIIRPIGRQREPIKLNWVTNYGGLVPECPHCGEMPYSLTECMFCGQRFLEDDND